MNELLLEDFVRQTTTPDLAKMIIAVADSSVRVWENLPTRTGMAGGVNLSGDRQTAIDLLANDEFVDSLLESGTAAEVASEEMEEPRKGRGSLHVAMDPLDGSSNIETNNPLGSIFGVYDSVLPCSGERMIASAFVTYGPILTLTFSTGRGVTRFGAVRKGRKVAFEMLKGELKIPDKPEVYGFGGPRKDWIPPIERFVRSLEQRGSRVRYCGTFVGDYNQVLKHGGIFGYPALNGRPKGKLRLLYEACPIAFITREAAGYSSDGYTDILKLRPSELSETTPVYTGSYSITKELEMLVTSG